MAWGGSAPNQTYTRTDGTRSGSAVNVQAKAAGVNDTAVLADIRENDFATALNLVLKRDGGNQPTAAMPWNSQRLTGLGQGTARTDAISLDQVQDGDLTYAEASGTANTIVLTTTPTCSPIEGMVIGFFAEFDSTSTVTVDLNGNGNVALQYIGAALVSGEIQNGQFHQVAFDGTVWQLANPYPGAVAQPLDADLTALAANSTNGLWARTGAGTGSARTLTGTAAQITVTDGDGVAGNPTLSLPSDVLIPTVLTVPNTGLHLLDTNASHDLIVKPGSNITADRTLTLTTGDADRTLDISAASVIISSYAATVLDDADAAAALATLTALGQGKHTVWIPAGAMISRTTNGAAAGTVEMATNKNMFKTLDFDTTTQEFAQFEIFFPKSWNLSTVTFQPVWSHPSTTTNFGVVWGLAGVARSDDDAGDVAFGTAQTSADTGGTTNDIYIGPESSAITIAGTPAAGDTVQFQINRTVADGGDTLAVDARLHGIRLFYTVNAATDA
jgi:hypothetical protein